ncbi:bifunctional aspartate kinase/homoserine dehydrogenase I [Buchnera aphidicola]|uniref:bifunctional aspartate kinase/homoserine dehydrogenase I n=1 Tax=Buchnera aphidicola TaxID=9 RepID=UPI0031B73996
MRVLKFGGTSLANAKKFEIVSQIILKKIQKEQICVVLSAPATLTNFLVNSIPETFQKKKKNTEYIYFFCIKIINSIKILKNTIQYKNLKTKLEKRCHFLENLYQKIKTLKKCPDFIKAQIISIGEKISVDIMKNILSTYKFPITIIRPEKSFITTGSYLKSKIILRISQKNILKLKIPSKNIILMPGFIAGNFKKKLVVLGRNGSDYSAAALSVCINAKNCEIWTDVNGVYTCDPQKLSTGIFLKHLSYQEAQELSFFGAKILHPQTISPLKKKNISCIIKNTNNPNNLGTIINNKIKKKDTVKGVTYIHHISQIIIKISHITNIFKYFSYVTKEIHEHNIKIFFLKFSRTYKKIFIYIPTKNSLKILKFLKKIFFKELTTKKILYIQEKNSLSLIAIISSNFYKKKYVIKKIFETIQIYRNFIIEISHNLYNYSFLIILKSSYFLKIFKNLHNNIFLSIKKIHIFLIGIGNIGSTLLKQINIQKESLKKKNIKIYVHLISNSKKFLFHQNHIKNCNLHIFKKKSLKKFNLKKILNLPKDFNIPNPIFVDCTSSLEIAKNYIKIFKKGFHIVSANKKSNTINFTEYQKIHNTSFIYKKNFFYETHVGAGLPIIKNLKNLLLTGDKLEKFYGILSGSMSYIFGLLENGFSFSKAVKNAKKLGYTEPDPREDLSGIDIARKLLIIAREIGYSLELSDIKIEKILPKEILKLTDIKQVMLQLTTLDSLFFKKYKKAQKNKKVLRFVGSITNKGTCKVKIKYISKKNPLHKIKNGENIFIFYTKYYSPIPLILRGYGAGKNVTAAGIFSDVLNI